jgi:hypothetical protein
MHPFVATAIVNEIVDERRQTARHARAVRRRDRRQTIRRAVTGR